MRWIEVLNEKLVIQGEKAHSDVDGQLRELKIYLNPSRSETTALLGNCIDDAGLRGYLLTSGDVLIWDSYIADHAGAEDIFRVHGFPRGECRFAIGRAGYSRGEIYVYETDIYRDRTEDKTAALIAAFTDGKNITRMFGKSPILNYD